MIVLMRAVKRHYDRVAREIDLDRPIDPSEVTEPIVVVPIDRWSRITEKALAFALSMSSDIRCLHVQRGDEPDEICEEWEKDIAGPLRAAGKRSAEAGDAAVALPVHPRTDGRLRADGGARERDRKVCVLVPELVVRHWWENMLHNRRADLLKVILLMRGNRRIVVINIPWYLEKD